MSDFHKGSFGSCCNDLSDAMSQPSTSFFLVEENEVLFLTVGYMQEEEGTVWFDQAVMFCPFCGKQLQTPIELENRKVQ